MISIDILPEARRDLDDILYFTFCEWGMQQAEHYLSLLHLGIDRLSDMPKLGLACDEIHPGYRKLLIEKHVVYYRRDDHRVFIIRIIDQRMDIKEDL